MNRRSFLFATGIHVGSTLAPQYLFKDKSMLTPSQEIHPFQLGSFKCTLLKDLLYSYRSTHYFSNVDPEDAAAALKLYDQNSENISSPFVSLLLEREDDRILIDTGMGYMSHPMEFQGKSIQFKGHTLQHLQALEIPPEKISHLIISHCHPDHIGGLCDEESRPIFPHARHILHQDEYEFWTTSKAKSTPPLFQHFITENVVPLKGVDLFLMKGQEEEVISGLTLIKVPGHTQGQVAIRIQSEGEKLLFISDVWLHPLHIEHLDWRTSYDSDHERAKSSRIQMLELAYKENMMVQSFHFDFPGLGHIDKTKKGWSWQPIKE